MNWVVLQGVEGHVLEQASHLVDKGPDLVLTLYFNTVVVLLDVGILDGPVLQRLAPVLVLLLVHFAFAHLKHQFVLEGIANHEAEELGHDDTLLLLKLLLLRLLTLLVLVHLEVQIKPHGVGRLQGAALL